MERVYIESVSSRWHGKLLSDPSVCRVSIEANDLAQPPKAQAADPACIGAGRRSSGRGAWRRGCGGPTAGEFVQEFSGRSEWSEDPSCEPRIWAFAAAASRCPQPLISTSPDSNTSKTTIIIHIILHILLHHGHFKS